MPRTIRSYDTHPITIREVQVAEILDVTPGMRRIIVTGPHLAAFERQGFPQAPVVSDGFDDHIKILFPQPGEELTLPAQADGHCKWERSQLAMTRNYTVRWHDPDTGRMAIDFVRHGAGPATTWAYRCRVGDSVWFAGPKECAGFPRGVDWHLVVGDETALPAIGRWLEEAPVGTRGQIFVEVTSTDHIQHDLPEREGIELTWLVRPGGSGETLLENAVRAADWWPGSCYAFVAGEALAIKAIRRFLRNDRGVPPEHLEVVGYWRRTEQDTDAPQPVDAAQPAMVLHELAELMPPMALRAAVTIGLPRAWAGGAESVTELARRTGAQPEPLRRLLRALVSIGVAEATSSGFRPTAMGAELEEERVADLLDLNRPAAREQFNLTNLVEALGVRPTGEDPEPHRHRAAAGRLAYVATDVARHPSLATARTVGLAGHGVIALAEPLLRLHPQLRVHLAVPGSLQPVIDAELGRVPDAHGRAASEGCGPDLAPASAGAVAGADVVVVLAGLLTSRTDEGVASLLATLRRANPDATVVLIDSFRDDSVSDEHDCEHDLVALTTHGIGIRTVLEASALLASAGFEDVQTSRAGWEGSCLVARPSVTEVAAAS